MLGEDPEEALDRAEQRAVDHHRTLAGAVGRGVVDAEALGQVEVELHGRHLPGATDGVAGLDRDLRAVERRTGGVRHELEARLLGDLTQGLRRDVPDLVVADVLLRVLRRQLEVEVVEAVVAQEREHEREGRGELLLHLLLRGEDVRVVLGQAAHAGEAVDDAGLLVAVHRAELEHPERQVAVGAGLRPVRQDVHRAVHRLEVVVGALPGDVAVLVLCLVHMHGREHAVLVPAEVPGGLEQVALGDVGRVDERVAVLLVPTARVVLHLAADDAALRVEDRQAGTDLVGEREQVEFGAELAVVALGGFLEAHQVRLELVLVGPGGAVDALQLRVLLGAAPVRGGDAHELGGVADPAGVRDVRAAAEVLPEHLARLRVDVLVHGELAGTDLDALAGVAVGRCTLEADELLLVGLPRHQLACLLVGDDHATEALGLLDDAVHALLDRLEVFGGEGLGDVEVVVEAIGDGRPDAELGVRVDLLHGLRQHVGGRVAEDVEPVLLLQGDGLGGLAGLHVRREVLQDTVDTDRDDAALTVEELGAGRGRRRGPGLGCLGKLGGRGCD